MKGKEMEREKRQNVLSGLPLFLSFSLQTCTKGFPLSKESKEEFLLFFFMLSMEKFLRELLYEMAWYEWREKKGERERKKFHLISFESSQKSLPFF